MVECGEIPAQWESDLSKDTSSGIRQIWVRIPPLPLKSLLPLGKLLLSSEPVFSSENWGVSNNRTYVIGTE